MTETETDAPTVVDREWTEAATSTHRYEQLVVERDGERLTVPITGIDHPAHAAFWDADRVYVHDGRLVAEAERVDGTVWTIEESGRTSDGDVAFDGHVVENPTDTDVADAVLWTRDGIREGRRFRDQQGEVNQVVGVDGDRVVVEYDGSEHEYGRETVLDEVAEWDP